MDVLRPSRGMPRHIAGRAPQVPRAGAEPGLAAGWEQVPLGSSVGGWAGSTRCGYMSPTLSIV